MPTFHASANANVATAATTINVPVPTYTVGDLLLAFLCIAQNTSTNDFSSVPGGWTLIDNLQVFNPGTSRVGIWWRIAASEPGTYQWGTAATDNWAAVMASYSGVDSVAPINQHSALSSPGNESTGVTNSITPTVDGCLIVGAFGEDGLGAGGVGTWSAASGETLRDQAIDTTQMCTACIEDIAQATAAAITVSATYTNSPLSPTNMGKLIVALAPPSAVAAPLWLPHRMPLGV
jgi:hypothetical protein